MGFAFNEYLKEMQAILTKRARKKLGITHARPWMREREINILVEIINALNPKRCLEWGSGYSTLTFASFLKDDAEWYSIEHHRGWFDRVKDLTAQSNHIKYWLVEPNQIPWEDDGDANSFADYVSFPETLQQIFDFILVDGRARVDCIHRAINFVSPDGVIVLHDANREKYLSVIDLFEHHLLFQDHRTSSGGLLLLSQNRHLTQLLDVAHHQAIWHTHQSMSRIHHKLGI